MNNSTIKKLLASHSEDDVRVGWELLKAKKLGPTDKRWYEYWDCFRMEIDRDSDQIRELKCSFIAEICPNYSEDPFWLNWKPKK